MIADRRTRAVLALAVGLAGLAPGGRAGAAEPPALPAPRPMSELRITATIPIAKRTDWVRVTPGGVWVGSKDPFAVNLVDPASNQVAVSIPLPGDPCAGLVSDAETLWAPLCGPTPKLAKIDLKTRTLAAVFDVGPGARESSVALGAGSVWLMVDPQGVLARIDAATGAVTARIQLPAGSYNPVFSDGRVWVSRAEGAELTVVDPATNTVVDHVATGPRPRFLTAGAGAVWTLNQGDGSLSRIDAAGKRPVASIPLQTPGGGGDIAYGDGLIWVTVMKTPLTAVDARRGVVLCQWKGAGGDALGVGLGSVWLTDLTGGTLLRIALSDVPKDCQAPPRFRWPWLRKR